MVPTEDQVQAEVEVEVKVEDDFSHYFNATSRLSTENSALKNRIELLETQLAIRNDRLREIDVRREDGYEAVFIMEGWPQTLNLMLSDINFLRTYAPSISSEGIIAAELEAAKLRVQPIIDREKEGENVGDVMGLRLDSNSSKEVKQNTKRR